MTKTKKTAEQIETKAKTIVKTDIDGIVKRFLDLTSTTFIQLWQCTPNISRMRKTGNRFAGLIEKLNCLNCVTNYNYEAMVNKARSKESMGDLRLAMVNAGVPDDKIDDFFSSAKADITVHAETFKAGINNVGDYVGDSKCIMVNTPKTGQWAGIEGNYIQVRPLNYAVPVYRWIGGEHLTEAEVTEMKSFITPEKPNANQGLKKAITIRSPRFETVVRVTLNGVNYKVE